MLWELSCCYPDHPSAGGVGRCRRRRKAISLALRPFVMARARICPGNRCIGSAPLVDLAVDPGYGAIRALDPRTGDRVWEYRLHTKP
jgi:hypothetical protein